MNRPVSALCIAEKLAFVLTPAWLCLPMTRARAELVEYMLRAKERQAASEHFTAEESVQLNSTEEIWLAGLKSSTRRWVEAHRDGREDTWTVGKQEEASERAPGREAALSDYSSPSEGARPFLNRWDFGRSTRSRLCLPVLCFWSIRRPTTHTRRSLRR